MLSSSSLSSASIVPANPSQPTRQQHIRHQLCQAHHLAVHLKLEDTIFTHISARCPLNPNHFYLTPFGKLFQEVTPENFLTLDLSGKVVAGDASLNPAGGILHSALYEARPEIRCAVHFHSPSALAVSCLKDGLLPLTQFSMMFYRRLGYHTFEGISLDPEEKSRFVQSLGRHNAMLLRNHGLLTVAETIPQAFMTAYYLEKSCQIQLMAQGTGQPLSPPSPEVCEKTAQQFEGPEYTSRALPWEALVRTLLC